jgi:eukaryotic-like serine/threonine-protein kinase
VLATTCSTVAEMKLQEGEHVGSYTAIRELGHGGMSQVYLAHDVAHDRDVVLKFPNDDLMGDPASYERFQREVKIGNILDHPNIQKLYELGGDSQTPYLVLEYVPGTTLRDYLRKLSREGTQPAQLEALALPLAIQMGSALVYTHAKGVCHRDLKPENVIVTPEGVAKLMDFGIAFMEGARRVTWGPLSSQVGTPDYMAPEQIKGQRGDDRTDIYALGMMLYEFVAGTLPYNGDNALAVMNQHVTVSSPPLHRFNKHVSPALEEVILKAIRRKPSARWSSAQELLDALKNLDTVDVAALRAEREAEEASVAPSAGYSNDFGMPPWKVALVVVGTLVALVALVVVAQLLHHGK